MATVDPSSCPYIRCKLLYCGYTWPDAIHAATVVSFQHGPRAESRLLTHV